MTYTAIPEHPGCYGFDATHLPYQPNELNIPRYFMPNALGRAEREEAAARLLIKCQEVGQWCAVKVSVLMQQAHEDVKAWLEVQDARFVAVLENRRRLEIYSRRFAWYQAMTLLSLGLYRLFKQPPVKPELVVAEERSLPWTGCILSADFLMVGLVELRDQGYINVTRLADADVIAPTAKLLHDLAGWRTATD